MTKIIHELFEDFEKDHLARFSDYMNNFNNHPISEIIDYMWDMHDLIEDIRYQLSNTSSEYKKGSMTVSELSDKVAYEIYNLVLYVLVYNDGKPATDSIIIHNETELSIFIDIFGDAEVDAVKCDLNVVIGNIHFNHLTIDEYLIKENEYIHRAYL